MTCRLPLTLALLWPLIACGGSQEDAQDPTGPQADGEVMAASAAWALIGNGVHYRATGGGPNVFIGYAGYGVADSWAQAWVDHLYAARLHALGVGYIYAVRGPQDPGYNAREIGNTKLIKHMLGLINGSTRRIITAGHSSGSFVAHEMLNFLGSGMDPARKTAGKVVYYDLDGGGGLSAAAAGRLAGLHFVYAQDHHTGSRSANAGDMMSLSRAYARAHLDVVPADGAGCQAGAVWCLHISLINTRPHDPAGANAHLDYSDFAGRSVTTAYLASALAAEGTMAAVLSD